MAKHPVIPVFYHPEPAICKDVLTACYRGGARLFEFTNRGDFAHELFAELSKFCRAELPEMILGAGSLADAGTTAIYLQSGANFVVSPSFRADIAVICNRRKIPWMPGCGSLTEIGKAEEAGADVVKLFPGNIYGPDFIKAAKGPQAHTDIMPTGGVSPEEENLKKWFSAGAYCVGMGSQLTKKNAAGKYDFSEIAALMKQSLAFARKYRKAD